MTAGKQATWQHRGVDEESLESWPYGRVEREGGEIRFEAEISKRTEVLAGLVNWGGKVRNKVPPGE
jgi:hypothetical protein